MVMQGRNRPVDYDITVNRFHLLINPINMDTSELKAMAETLAQARSAASAAKELYEAQRAVKDEAQQKLLDALNKCEIKSIKTDKCFFSSVTKTEPVVIDEAIVWDELTKRGLIDDHLKLDTTMVKSTAKAMLKETGEIMDGTEIRESSYISVRNNK